MIQPSANVRSCVIRTGSRPCRASYARIVENSAVHHEQRMNGSDRLSIFLNVLWIAQRDRALVAAKGVRRTAQNSLRQGSLRFQCEIHARLSRTSTSMEGSARERASLN